FHGPVRSLQSAVVGDCVCRCSLCELPWASCEHRQRLGSVLSGFARRTLIAKLSLFGPWALFLATFLVGPAATAYGDEADVVDVLRTGRIRTSATWCYKKPGPERCAATLHIKDGSLVLDGVGCGSFRVPTNGSNGRQAANISGNTLTVSVTGKD